MSKSYNNVIPLFASKEERQAAINKIVTDSSAPDEKKTVEGTALFDLYQLVANEEQAASFRKRLEDGQMGWGDAKQELAAHMNDYFDAMTHEYNRLMDNPDEIRQILHDGAQSVRPIAQEVMNRLRQAAGIL